MQVDREEFSIEQMMGYLFDQINTRGPVTLNEILPEIYSQERIDRCFPGACWN